MDVMSTTNVTMERMASVLSEGASGNSTIISGLDVTFVFNQPLQYAAVVFAVLSCFVSLVDLREHLNRFDYAKIQVLEMRIILMIPIYAFFSAISLLFPKGRFFYIIIRDTYEAIVLYIFFMLMIAYCGGEGQLLRCLKRKRYRGVHPWPLCWIPSYPLDINFYLRCKRWVLQCALIKPVTSFIAMVTDPFGIYQEGTFAVNNVYTYNCIIINFSLTWALYYLVLFEIECEKELHYAKTFLKFLCIKSIIFFSYWQSVAVTVLASAGVLYLGKDEHESERASAVIQDLLMCFELLPVAFLHKAAFGRDKLDEEMACVPVYMKDNNTGDFRSNVDTALDVNDIIDDTIGTIFYRKGKLLDMENQESDQDVDIAPSNFNGTNLTVGDAEMMMHDPTLEDLVRHAIMTDYGVRVDGALHFDEDSDRDERNQEMNFTETDVILHRSKNQKALDDVRVDAELLRSHQVQALGAPQIFCVVCGRFDREMVRRHNGYKCKECVGTKSQKILRHRQREENEDDDVHAGKHKGKSTVVIETLHDDDDQFVQPLPQERDADIAGLQRASNAMFGPLSALETGTSAISEGLFKLRQVILPDAKDSTDQENTPTCRSCGKSQFMVPMGEGRWRCSNCAGGLGVA